MHIQIESRTDIGMPQYDTDCFIIAVAFYTTSGKAVAQTMQQTLADVMGIDNDNISIKATTTEKLGFTGRKEGISAYATVLIEKISEKK